MATTQQRPSIAWRLMSHRTRFVVLALFLGSVFLMGGASRGDVLSLPALRPVALLFAAYALTVAEAGQLKAVAVPLALLGALAAIIAVQLIPLPPALWSALPGHGLYAEVVSAAGLGDVWRPLSLAPARTLNSLLSLVVPAAALLLYAVQGPGHGRLVMIAVFACGLFSALWGLLQLTGSSAGPLYLYRITNGGLPVGLFSNRNHHAVLLCALIPVAAHLALTVQAPRGQRQSPMQLVAMGAVLLLVATALMTGSRAGLIAMLCGFAAAAMLVYARRRHHRRHDAEEGPGRRPIGMSLILAGSALAVTLAVVVVFWFGKALALERLFQTDQIDETRTQILPILFDMVSRYFPTGAGFGAFDAVYDSVEPTRLLSDQYLNQAHNDLLQVLIEGGLPAALLLFVFICWLARQGRALLRALQRHFDGAASRKFAALSVIVTLGIVSAFDYPLRVPSIMAVFAIFCGMLAKSGERGSARPAEIGGGEEN